MDNNIIKPIKMVKEIITKVPVVVSVPYDNITPISMPVEQSENPSETEE